MQVDTATKLPAREAVIREGPHDTEPMVALVVRAVDAKCERGCRRYRQSTVAAISSAAKTPDVCAQPTVCPSAQ